VSLDKRRDTEHVAPRATAPAALPPATREECLAAAVRLGEKLAAQAIHGRSDVAWIGMNLEDLGSWRWSLSPLGVDLYLAGHTHGGQVRAPLYGAIVTFSEFGKRYEMGPYRVGGTMLYVNRGIGFEPELPRVRFLARPEVAVIDLIGG